VLVNQRTVLVVALVAWAACGKSSTDPKDRLHSKDPKARLDAVVAIREAGDTSAVDPLIGVMNRDDDGDVRRAAARALGELGDARAAAALVTVVASNQASELRTVALNALGQLKAPESVAGMIEVWKLDPTVNDNGPIQEGVRYTLRDMSAVAYDPLIAALRDPHPNVRAFAADTLALIGDKRAIKAIEPLVEDPDPAVRHEAETALERLAKP